LMLDVRTYADTGFSRASSMECRPYGGTHVAVALTVPLV
jgi:hypothetical protein